MKDIKSVVLPKYPGDDYEPVAFRVYRNKKARNYCLTLISDDMNEFIMDALMDQYSLNCGEYCGEKIVLNGRTVCIAEFETGSDTIADLQRILCLATAVGKEIVDFDIDGNVFLCVRTGNASFTSDKGVETVPVYGIRCDEYSGMLSFSSRYPEKPFTEEIGKIISSQILPRGCRFKAVLIQRFRAALLYEYNNSMGGLIYGFDERKCLGFVKGDNLVGFARGYVR